MGRRRLFKATTRSHVTTFEAFGSTHVMKRLRRLSLTLRRSSGQDNARRQTDIDSTSSISLPRRPRHQSIDIVTTDDEQARPTRKLLKKKNTRPPDVRRPTPSSSPSPTPTTQPLPRVPSITRKKPVPIVTPDDVPPETPPKDHTSTPPSSSSPPASALPSPSFDTPASPMPMPIPMPMPVPLSMIIEQDERSLRSTRYSARSTGAPNDYVDTRDHPRERTTSGARERTPRVDQYPPPLPPSQTSVTLRPVIPDSPIPDTDPAPESVSQSTQASEPLPPEPQPPVHVNVGLTHVHDHKPHRITPAPTHLTVPASNPISAPAPTSTRSLGPGRTSPDAYATATESLTGDTDGYATAVGDDGDSYQDEDGTEEGYATPMGGEDDDSVRSPSEEERTWDRDATLVGYDTPTVRVTTRVRQRSGVEEVFPHARRTFGMWERGSAEGDDEDQEEGDVESTPRAAKGGGLRERERDQPHEKNERQLSDDPRHATHHHESSSPSTTTAVPTSMPVPVPVPIPILPPGLASGLRDGKDGSRDDKRDITRDMAPDAMTMALLSKRGAAAQGMHATVPEPGQRVPEIVKPRPLPSLPPSVSQSISNAAAVAHAPKLEREPEPALKPQPQPVFQARINDMELLPPGGFPMSEIEEETPMAMALLSKRGPAAEGMQAPVPESGPGPEPVPEVIMTSRPLPPLPPPPPPSLPSVSQSISNPAAIAHAPKLVLEPEPELESVQTHAGTLPLGGLPVSEAVAPQDTTLHEATTPSHDVKPNREPDSLAEPLPAVHAQPQCKPQPDTINTTLIAPAPAPAPAPTVSPKPLKDPEEAQPIPPPSSSTPLPFPSTSSNPPLHTRPLPRPRPQGMLGSGQGSGRALRPHPFMEGLAGEKEGRCSVGSLGRMSGEEVREEEERGEREREQEQGEREQEQEEEKKEQEQEGEERDTTVSHIHRRQTHSDGDCFVE